jgi:hypothetical protein
MSMLAHFRNTPFIVAAAFAALLVWTTDAPAQPAKLSGAGVAWEVRGTWQVAGQVAPLRTGDALQPAALLEPDGRPGDHSVTILLPDGQRILYECFTAADCSRGYRVPALNSRPQAFAVDMLARIRTALAAGREEPADRHRARGLRAPVPDEAVAVLDSGSRVHVSGLLAELGNGHYTYNLEPRDPNYPAQFHLPLEKTTRSVELPLPAPGLYVITVSDAQNTPRVNLLLAAVRPGMSARRTAFAQARELIEDWDEAYAGWPIHDMLRAYLEALAAEPAPAASRK